jgi:hypothetical protein
MLVTTTSQSQMAVAAPRQRSRQGALIVGLGALLVASVAAVAVFLYAPEWIMPTDIASLT